MCPLPICHSLFSPSSSFDTPPSYVDQLPFAFPLLLRVAFGIRREWAGAFLLVAFCFRCFQRHFVVAHVKLPKRRKRRVRSEIDPLALPPSSEQTTLHSLLSLPSCPLDIARLAATSHSVRDDSRWLQSPGGRRTDLRRRVPRSPACPSLWVHSRGSQTAFERRLKGVGRAGEASEAVGDAPERGRRGGGRWTTLLPLARPTPQFS
ncbi:hypothetical protein AAT19DRAFT_9873 [Rhodotorula toruloides]|uniref:Uncharacterized protein n=1 Tax=Rhodotorula toruloides TaxID=5286 RepID=A0A2T0A165_RHOTO|nr:hypothetical protein AAT19DRAFT_9873 [Rhodotorula toruloides]